MSILRHAEWDQEWGHSQFELYLLNWKALKDWVQLFDLVLMILCRALYQLNLVKTEVARRFIPPELKVVQAFGCVPHMWIWRHINTKIIL